MAAAVHLFERTTARTTATDTNFVTAITLSASELGAAGFANDDEVLVLVWAVLANAGTSETSMRVTYNGSVITNANTPRLDFGAAGIERNIEWMGRLDLATLADLDVDVASSSTTDGFMERATVAVIRLADFGTEGTDWVWNKSTTNVAHTTTYSATNRAAVTVPASSGTQDWVIWGYVHGAMDSISTNFEARVMVDGALQAGDFSEEPESTTEEKTWLMNTVENLTSSTHSVTIESRDDAGTAANDHRESALFVFRKDVWEDVYYHIPGTVSVATATDVQVATVTDTLSTSQDLLLYGDGNINIDNANGNAFMWIRQDGSTIIEPVTDDASGLSNIQAFDTTDEPNMSVLAFLTGQSGTLDLDLFAHHTGGATEDLLQTSFLVWGMELASTATVTLFARLYQSDETTALSDEVQVAQVTADGSFANTSAITLTGIVPSTKAVWDGARLRLRWVGTTAEELQVSGVRVDLTYVVAEGVAVSPAAIARSFAIGAQTIHAESMVSPSVTSRAFVVDAPTIHAESTIIMPPHALRLSGTDRAVTVDRTEFEVGSSVLDVRAWITPNVVANNPQQIIVSQFITDGNCAWRVYLNTSGGISFGWTPDGTFANTVDVHSTSNLTYVDRDTFAIRAVHDPAASPRNTTFYHSQDGGITWTQLGDVRSFGTSGIIFNSTAELRVGTSSAGGPVIGDVLAAEVRIADVLVASPDFTDPSQGWVIGDNAADTGTDAQGNTWTLGGTTSLIVPRSVISVPSTLDAPTILAAARLLPASIARLFALDTPTIHAEATVLVAAIDRAFTLPTPTNPTVVKPATTSRVFTIDAPTAHGAARLLPASIARLFALNTPSIALAKIVTPETIARVFTADTPSILAESLVTPATLSRAFTLDNPTAHGQGAASPTTTARIFVLDAASILAESVVEPATIARSFTVETPSIQTNAQAAPATIARSFTVGQAAIQAGSNVVVGLMDLDAVLDAPTIQVTATREPETVAQAFTLPLPSLAFGFDVFPATISRSFAINTPTLNVPGSGSPAVISRAVVMPQATARGEVLIVAGVIDTDITLPLATISVPATTEPSVMNRMFVLGAASVLAEALVTPTVMNRVFGLPTPTIDVQGDGTATPQTIARSVNVDTPSIEAGANVLASAIAQAINLLQATARGEALASPAAISRLLTLGQATIDTATNVTADDIDLEVTIPFATLHAEALVTPAPMIFAITMPNAEVLIIRVIFVEGDSGSTVMVTGVGGMNMFEGSGNSSGGS